MGLVFNVWFGYWSIGVFLCMLFHHDDHARWVHQSIACTLASALSLAFAVGYSMCDAPDAWEEDVLRAFSRGRVEASSRFY